MKRTITVLGFAAAAAVSPLVVASPAAAATCPYGTQPRFDGVCISGASPSSGMIGPANSIQSVSPAGPDSDVVANPGQLPTVRGIPCTPEHLGTCIGLIQSQQ